MHMQGYKHPSDHVHCQSLVQLLDSLNGYFVLHIGGVFHMFRYLKHGRKGIGKRQQRGDRLVVAGGGLGQAGG